MASSYLLAVSRRLYCFWKTNAFKIMGFFSPYRMTGQKYHVPVGNRIRDFSLVWEIFAWGWLSPVLSNTLKKANAEAAQKYYLRVGRYYM